MGAAGPVPCEIRRFEKRRVQEFKELLQGAEIEVIEVKRRLNRVVLGQVIIGADFMEMEYGLRPDQIRQVVIVKIGDPALEELCRRRGIEVCFGT